MSKVFRSTFSYILAAVLICLSSCGEGARCAQASGLLLDGGEDRASLSFSMNRRSVRVELFLRLDGGKALVTIDHPDGRTTETLPVEGAGVHELRKELPKEPGSWGLGLEAEGGAVAYWYALHDSGSYLGVNDEVRSLVELK